MKIIADIGSNWLSLKECIYSIESAAYVGADAVKFQFYNHEDLYGLEGKMASELKLEWLPTLAEHAKKQNIEFMCTPFSVKGVKVLNGLVSAHKIASSDMMYPQLLDACMDSGKHLIISTGGKLEEEILRVMEYVEGYDCTFLYCSSSYPCRDHDLFKIDRLRELAAGRFEVGYSDHTPDIYYAPYCAKKVHNASILEKHMTAFPNYNGADRPHSLSTNEFKLMVDKIKGINGSDQVNCNFTDSEVDMRLLHNRRLVCTRYIRKGQKYTYGFNYGAYRAKDENLSHFMSINPMDWKTIEGLEATETHRLGTSL